MLDKKDLKDITQIVKSAIVPLNLRLTKIESRLGGVDKRLDGVEKQVRKTNKTLNAFIRLYDSETGLMKKRLDRIENNLDLPSLPNIPKS